MDVYKLRIGKLVATFMIGCRYLFGNLIGFGGKTRVRFINLLWNTLLCKKYVSNRIPRATSTIS
jgi:hypothetical protein